MLDPEARRRKIAALKAQADIEAEKMRQRIAEKQKERMLAAGQDQIKQTHVIGDQIKQTHVIGGAGSGESVPAAKEKKPQEHQEEQHERPQWGDQRVAPIAFAQQPEATGRVTEG